MTWRQGRPHPPPEAVKLAHLLRCKPLPAPTGLAGRIRLLAAGERERRDTSILLFEPDACTWSGGPSTRRVQDAPVALSRPGYRCAAPASGQPCQTRRGRKRRFTGRSVDQDYSSNPAAYPLPSQQPLQKNTKKPRSPKGKRGQDCSVSLAADYLAALSSLICSRK